jgi:hypothetical protein
MLLAPYTFLYTSGTSVEVVVVGVTSLVLHATSDSIIRKVKDVIMIFECFIALF